MARSRNRSHIVVMPLLVASMALLTVPVFGQIGGRDISESNMTDVERRESTLLWLDTFLTESDLLRRSDMAKIREAVSQMSPSQLQQWLEQTKQLRSYVEGERWQETKKWLREFLRVQAMYSEQEVQKLRDEIVLADATEMLSILKRIQAKHDALVWMHEAAERNREAEIAVRDAYVQQRNAVTETARVNQMVDAPLFGTGLSTTRQKASQEYQIPRMLINSRQLSRAAVWSEIWGPGWLIGF